MAAIFDPYIQNTDQSLHLRDARHAHQLYNEHNFAYAPKTKFLYHIVFEFNQQVATSGKIPNCDFFRREIGVLVKASDLPGFKVSTETIQQYNRKKVVQTRLDYDPVSVTFHDDNTGVTRAMFDEYYRYYFQDGNKNNDGVATDYDPRDKFGTAVPRYGLDNGTDLPFFTAIRLYQLSRQRWFGYTLINPLVTAWKHDKLDNSSGGETMENILTLMYEGVLYTHGDIVEDSDPAGFASQQTRYDLVPSPLGAASEDDPTEPALIEANYTLTGSQNYPTSENVSSAQGSPDSLLSKISANPAPDTIGGLQQIVIPKTNTQDPAVKANSLSTTTSTTTSSSSTSTATRPYTIVQGDTLTAIARRNGTTVNALLAANPQIKNPDLIYAGATLNIPVTNTSTSTTTTSTVSSSIIKYT